MAGISLKRPIELIALLLSADLEVSRQAIFTTSPVMDVAYDRYGNRNFVTGSGHTTTLGSCTTMCNPTFSSTTNRITSSGYSFDASGNTTADPDGRSFVYDGENKQVSVETGSTLIGTYAFDGDGKRIKKIDATGGTLFLYDAAGRLVEEIFTAVPNCEQGQRDCKVEGPVTTSYVYAGGRLLSTEKPDGTNYLTADHLGSPRINTDNNGSVIARHDYMPFGEEIDGTGGRTTGLGYATDSVRKQFTGYERDTETDLDYAQARMFGSGFGRFTSPDPLMASARKARPQTFNRYVYVANNPLNYVDPSGMMGCPPENPNCGPTTDGFVVTNPCNMAATGCYPIDLGTVEFSDTPPLIETTTATVSSEITARPLEQAPTAGFVGPPPVIAPGVPAPVTTAPPGAAPVIGRVVGLLGRSMIASMLAPAAVILALASTVQAPSPAPATPTTTTTTTDEDSLRPNSIIVRGGTSAIPPLGTPFSAAFGASVQDAAAYVPHGQIRFTTMKAIVDSGGSVVLVPEMTRGGNLNLRHVNVTEGIRSTFSPLFPNPVPRANRIQ